MKWLALGALAIVVIAATVALLAGERVWTTLAGPADQGSVDYATLTLKDTPNQFLVCPPGRCAAPADIEAPTFAVPEADLRASLIRIWSAMPRTRLTAGGPEPSTGEIRFVQTSAVFGFPDTISVATWPSEDGTASTLAVYSRSLVGRSDLGANEERITKWLSALSELPRQ